MLRLARSRLLPRSEALAPRASCLALVDAARFFSSQTGDGDVRETDDKPSLLSVAAWEEAVKPAYLTFLSLNKHLMVPVKFVVPSEDDAWPGAAQGYALGKHAEWLRKQWREGGKMIKLEQLKELEEMPFAWDRSQYKWDHYVLPALRRFYELNGNTDVPKDFRVRKGDPKWLDRLWGQKLGSTVSSIRLRGDFVKQVKADADELERIKFCHDSTLSDRDWREKLIPALKVFRQEFGHCNVGQNFTVPSSFPWPKAAWKMHLGNAVNSIRCGELGVGRDHRELDELGFVWDYYEHEWSERILPALERYRKMNGHCRVPSSFVVPLDDSWPKQLWGLQLGVTVNTIRTPKFYSAQASRDKRQLEKLGFVWNFFEAEWNGRILPALKTYFQENGHSRVPRSFVVPSDAAWPTEAHGLKLGLNVSNIRHHGNYFDYTVRSVDTLQAIGFELKIPDAKWKSRVEPLLTMFEQLYGHRTMPRAFVVPSKAPWGEKDWGIQLGKLERKMPSQEA